MLSGVGKSRSGKLSRGSGVRVPAGAPEKIKCGGYGVMAARETVALLERVQIPLATPFYFKIKWDSLYQKIRICFRDKYE